MTKQDISKLGDKPPQAKPRGFTRRPDTAEVGKMTAITAEFASRPPAVIGGPELAARAMAAEAAGQGAGYAIALHAQPESPVEKLLTVAPRSMPVGTVHDIPVGEIIENPYNARRTTAMGRIEELGISLRENGQEMAATAYINEHGNVCLIDGGRRLLAARTAGIRTLRVEIRPQPKSNRELYLHSRRANSNREDENPLDDALAWSLMLSDGTYKDQKEIHEDTGVDEAIISKTLSLLTIPRALITIITEQVDLLKLRMLTAIRRFFEEHEKLNKNGEEAAEKLIWEIKEKKLSAREVEKRIDAIGATKKTRNRADDHWRENYGRSTAEIKRFAGSNTLMLELITPDDPEAVIELEKEFKKLIDARLKK